MATFAADDFTAIRRAAWVQHMDDKAWQLRHCFRARGMLSAECGCIKENGGAEACPEGWQERAAASAAARK